MAESSATADDSEIPLPGSSVQPSPSIVDLPIEVILKIFDSLEPLFLHRVMSRVCKKFNLMLYHEYLWKKLFLTKNNLSSCTTYPYLEHIGLYSSKWKTGNDISWRDLVVSVEKSRQRWFDGGVTVSFSCEETTNVVHVMKGGFCLTGSRERSIQVWDSMSARQVSHSPNAHNGWLSGISTIDNTVVSCGWDSYVKLWNFQEEMAPLSAYNLDHAVMAVACQPQMVAACTFPELVIIDPRIGRHDGLCKFPMEEGSLVQLEYWQNYIVLASRSKNLTQFDLRMGRTILRESIQTVSPPRTMSILDDIVYVGDNAGWVYLFDLHNKFKMIKAIEICEKKTQIRALVPRKGYVIVGSSDGVLQTVLTVKGHENIISPSNRRFKGEITTGHYRDDVLAIVDGSSGVTVFLP